MKKELIIKHYKKPLNWGKLKTDTYSETQNSSCGDGISMFLEIKDDVVVEAKFKGFGCSICLACGSLVTDNIKGKSIENILKLGENYPLSLIDMEESSPRKSCAILSMKAVLEAINKTR